MISLRSWEIDEKRGGGESLIVNSTHTHTTGRIHDEKTEQPADTPEVLAKASPQSERESENAPTENAAESVEDTQESAKSKTKPTLTTGEAGNV